ncbi:hypothetical protein EJ04DRAFT_515625 [Polyplosphaeria fusca]|uniref:Uncharacterized protein n=1 Tax=Polyplosphaeria fusca TaxID=682080 RepID=A0A9P4QM59_9PLEO|nr:hypothetical protein EJ04DRAFT_515625 [Polyplosphaeria fusca]
MTLFGYPSKGGVVALSPAYAPDFDFLGLDGSVLTTQSESYEDSVQEDAFSKHILLLGAKWWDSLHRYEVITGAQAGNEDCMYRLDNGEEPEPTIRDKVWVSVAWPSGGGVVVAEFHNTQLDWHGEGGRDYGIPEDVARLGLCRDMDERATMLRERFEGKWYENVGYYEGDGFLNAWTWQCGVEHEGVEKESD